MRRRSGRFLRPVPTCSTTTWKPWRASIRSVRPQAVYDRSLELLRRTAALAPEMAVKSGLMLGLGERPEEVEAALRDLLAAGCRILTLGQYLQPKRECLPVARYLPPAEFDCLAGGRLRDGLCAGRERPPGPQFLPCRGRWHVLFLSGLP